MNQRSTILISVAVLLIFCLFLIINANNKQKFDWDLNFKKGNKQPYGSFVIHNLLQNYFPNQNFYELKGNLATDLPDQEEGGANYFFVGEGLYLDSAGTKQLLEFVHNGNTAFISSLSIPNDLMTYYLYYEECDYNYWTQYSYHDDTAVNMNLLHPDLNSKDGFEYKFTRNHETQQYGWRYIPSYYFCEEVNLVDLGYMNDTLINFAKIPHGDGAFYLHTSPTVFTNYNLIKDGYTDYPKRLLAHLEKGDIYWDVRSKIPGPSPDINQDQAQNPIGTQKELPDNTPLEYILSQDSLRWGWYVLLGMTGLFLLVRTRRRQRIVPVLEENTNTSLEYVDTIGRLYFQQNDHRTLGEEQIKLFLAFIRERYQINTNETSEDFTKKLAIISQIPEKEIKKIFIYQKQMKKSDGLNNGLLIDMHLAIDYFYKNCK